MHYFQNIRRLLRP